MAFSNKLFLDKAKVWIFGKFETLPKTHTQRLFSVSNYLDKSFNWIRSKTKVLLGIIVRYILYHFAQPEQVVRQFAVFDVGTNEVA
jgi:hemerythrin